MNKLQQIFLDNYEEIILTLRLRDCERENIDKMINCGNPAFGGAMYACTKCGKMKFVPFRCHSRFCPTCGVKYAIDRTTAMSFKVIGVAHRHCVFTIAEELRDLFLKDRDLLNLLFDAVNSVVSRMFHKLNKKENFTPGFICVLHTFGRDLKWNPHIHCLISEGGLSDKGFWRNVHYFNYKLLRDSFQTALLSLLHKRLGDSFKKTKAAVYRNHKNGFYVYAKPKKCEPSKVLKYVGRYLVEDAVVNPDGTISPSKTKNDRTPVFKRGFLSEYSQYNPFDRNQMVFSNLMSAYSVTKPVKTALMTCGGWNMEDAFVIVSDQ